MSYLYGKENRLTLWWSFPFLHLGLNIFNFSRNFVKLLRKKTNKQTKFQNLKHPRDIFPTVLSVSLLLNFGLTYISVCCKLQVGYVWINKSLSLRALFPFYVVKTAETLVVLFFSVCENRLSSYNNSCRFMYKNSSQN